MEIATIVLTGVTVLIAAFALWAARATLREARETVKLARDAQAKFAGGSDGGAQTGGCRPRVEPPLSRRRALRGPGSEH